MAEFTITVNSQTSNSVEIRQTVDGLPGSRLLAHAIPDGRIFVRTKNKTAVDVRGMVKVPKGKRLAVEEMRR